MNLQSKIASNFNIGTELDVWHSIHCPFHAPDNHMSAGLIFNEDGTGAFNCFTPGPECRARSLKQFALDVGIDPDDGDIGLIIGRETSYAQASPDNTSRLPFPWLDQKPLELKNHVQVFGDFLYEKHLKMETIDALGGKYITDASRDNYGYLEFKYGEEGSVSRRILEDAQRPRFLNSAGSKKLFTHADLQNIGSIVLCEGLTDYLTLYQIGCRNIGASLGAQISNEQAYLLRNKTVFIVFDKDYAGYLGSKRAEKLLSEFSATPIVLEIPDTFRREGDAKIDINSAYSFNESGFTEWLESSLRKYDVFDKSFVEKEFFNSMPIKYYKIGIEQFDKDTGGIAQGLTGIAGEPGAGKSTLVCQIADQFVESGLKTLVVSYELSKAQMWARIASRYSNYSWTDIEKDTSILEGWVKAKLEFLSNYLRIDDHWSIGEIKHASKDFDAIVVDYLQEMPAAPSSISFEDRSGIRTNLRELSQLANRDNKIVIFISSVARSQYGLDSIAAFKETGDAEFKVQLGVVMRPSGEDVLFTVIKNRRGAKRTYRLKPTWEHQWFEGLDPIFDDAYLEGQIREVREIRNQSRVNARPNRQRFEDVSRQIMGEYVARLAAEDLHRGVNLYRLLGRSGIEAQSITTVENTPPISMESDFLYTIDSPEERNENDQTTTIESRDSQTPGRALGSADENSGGLVQPGSGQRGSRT